MSSYKQLTNTPAYNFGGEMKWDTKTPSDGWVVVDGSIVAINTAPNLLDKIGFIEDSITATYTTANITNFSNNINAIVFANNSFVAAGDGGLVATSPDYTNWTVRTSGTANNINTLIFANNIFVYAGNNGTLATSSDAVTWTQRTSGTSNNINDLIFANNTFVYVGDNGTLSTSPNAVTWTARTSGAFSSANINSITYGNGIFSYVADSGHYGTSSDAITWLSSIESVYVGGKTFSRVGTTSTTNVSLTDLTGGLASAPQANDVVFVAVATGSTANRSQAVTGYTQIASLYANRTVDTNLWVGYKIMTSTPDTIVTIPSTGSTADAQTVAIQVWRNLDTSNLFNTTATTFTDPDDSVQPNPPAITTISDNCILLVVGATSLLGLTSTLTAPYLSNFLTTTVSDTNSSTIGFGSIFRETAGAYDPAPFTSSRSGEEDSSAAAVTIALNPTTVPLTFTSNNLNSITYGSNTFLIGGDSGSLFTSSSMSSFTSRTSGTPDNINVVSFLNNRFLYGTFEGTIGISSDAITWTIPTPDTVGKNYVGGKTFSTAGTTSITNISLTDLTGGIGSAPQVGDLIIIAVATASDTIRSQSLAGEGYSEIVSLYVNSTRDTNLWVGHYFLPEGEEPVTSVNIPASGSLNDAQTVAIQVWRNTGQNFGVSLFDAIQTTSTATNTSVVNPPSITTVSNNSVLIVIGASAHSQATATFTAPYLNNFLTVGANDFSDSTIGMGSLYLETPQTYDPAAWTFSGTDSSLTSYASVTIALRFTFGTGINDFTYGKGVYVSGRDSARTTEIGFYTYNYKTEFKLPTITDSSIVSGINNRTYIKLA